MDDRLIARLMTTFLEELEEHVLALNRDVLALEKDEGPARVERLTTLLRTAHSLKGAARAVSVPVIERACHELETVFQGVREERLAVGPDLCSLLLAAADGIEEAGSRLRAQQPVDGGPLAALLPRLRSAAGGATSAGPAPVPLSVASTGAPPTDGVVRVRAERLDALLARTGEQLVTCRRVESRHEEVAALRDLVGRWRVEWRAAEKALGAVRRQAREATPKARPKVGRVALASQRMGDRLRRLEEELEHLRLAMAADSRMLGQAAGALEDDVRRARMLPFAEACVGLDRVARDLTQACGKEATLVIDGGHVELDRTLLEALKDPLRHLVRNAVDHGLEEPAARREGGKPERGTITVRAVVRGATVEVVVVDDGRGLDLGALREQASKRGMALRGDERDLAQLVFEPGLTTAHIITDVSGRGVGLDVVKSRVESLHGTVDVRSVPGRGTTFVLTLPLTVTTLHALLVTSGGQTFALSSGHVGELRRVDAEDVRRVQGRAMLRIDETLVPVLDLAETLGLAGGEPPQPGGRVPVVTVSAGEQRAALVVDALLAEQEIVVKSLGARLQRVHGVTGATLLPSGHIALVLNAGHLVRRAHGRGPGPSVAVLATQTAAARKRVLLVDDSITTRSLERSLLEAAGYEVEAAVDGEAAWRLLEEHGADVVVSDIEMPHMDGFALTEAIRASTRFRELPVVLVTGLARDEDRARGMQAGANAYLVKSVFDQTSFLDTIAQLL